MEEFQQQLGAVKSEMTQKMQAYPDMDPEERRECQERLDHTVKTLLKIQKNLVDADKSEMNPDSRIVRVLGLHTSYNVDASHFVRSFEQARFSGFNPSGLKLFKETNYPLDGSGKVLPAPVDEWYISFRLTKEAEFALTIRDFQLNFSGTGRTVKFAKPATPSPVRATFREIGALVERIKEIENERKEMGAVYEYGEYKPDPNQYLDKAWFMEHVARTKRVREAGQSLDHHAYGPLKHRKPIDTAAWNTRAKRLYDEECDVLIALRQFQFEGVEFDF